MDTNIVDSSETLINPPEPLSVRLYGTLLYGLVWIYSRQAKYLLDECVALRTQIVIFSSNASVDLRKKVKFDSITLPDAVDWVLDAAIEGQSIDFRSISPTFHMGGFMPFTARVDDITMDIPVPDTKFQKRGLDMGLMGDANDFEAGMDLPEFDAENVDPNIPLPENNDVPDAVPTPAADPNTSTESGGKSEKSAGTATTTSSNRSRKRQILDSETQLTSDAIKFNLANSHLLSKARPDQHYPVLIDELFRRPSSYLGDSLVKIFRINFDQSLKALKLASKARAKLANEVEVEQARKRMRTDKDGVAFGEEMHQDFNFGADIDIPQFEAEGIDLDEPEKLRAVFRDDADPELMAHLHEDMKVDTPTSSKGRRTSDFGLETPASRRSSEGGAAADFDTPASRRSDRLNQGPLPPTDENHPFSTPTPLSLSDFELQEISDYSQRTKTPTPVDSMSIQTVRLLLFLRRQMGQEASPPSMDFETMVADQTRSIVARSFVQMLVLNSSQHIVMKQAAPYAPIAISPGPHF